MTCLSSSQRDRGWCYFLARILECVCSAFLLVPRKGEVLLMGSGWKPWSFHIAHKGGCPLPAKRQQHSLEEHWGSRTQSRVTVYKKFIIKSERKGQQQASFKPEKESRQRLFVEYKWQPVEFRSAPQGLSVKIPHTIFSLAIQVQGCRQDILKKTLCSNYCCVRIHKLMNKE